MQIITSAIVQYKQETQKGRYWASCGTKREDVAKLKTRNTHTRDRENHHLGTVRQHNVVTVPVFPFLQKRTRWRVGHNTEKSTLWDGAWSHGLPCLIRSVQTFAPWLDVWAYEWCKREELLEVCKADPWLDMVWRKPEVSLVIYWITGGKRKAGGNWWKKTHFKNRWKRIKQNRVLRVHCWNKSKNTASESSLCLYFDCRYLMVDLH